MISAKASACCPEKSSHRIWSGMGSLLLRDDGDLLKGGPGRTQGVPSQPTPLRQESFALSIREFTLQRSHNTSASSVFLEGLDYL